MLSGFPPKPMELADSDAITGKLMNGDTVVVNAAPTAASESPKPGTATAG